MLCNTWKHCSRANAAPLTGPRCSRLHRSSLSRKYGVLTARLENKTKAIFFLSASLHAPGRFLYLATTWPQSRCFTTFHPPVLDPSNAKADRVRQTDEDLPKGEEEYLPKGEEEDLPKDEEEEKNIKFRFRHFVPTKKIRDMLPGVPDRELEFIATRLGDNQNKISRNDKRMLQDRYRQWGYWRWKFARSERDAALLKFNEWKDAVQSLCKSYPFLYEKEFWPSSGESDFIRLFHSLPDLPSMRQTWNALEFSKRKSMWQELMLMTMRERPGKIIMVLHATLDPLPPPYAIMDVLRVVIGVVYDLESAKHAIDKDEMADEILALLTTLIEDLSQGEVSQSLLGMFGKKLPVDHSRKLLSVMHQRGLQLHSNTLLHFARKLAEQPADKKLVFELLKGMAEEGVSLNSDSVSSVITVLLHCKAPEDPMTPPAERFSPRDALQVFLHYGYQPNMRTLTVLLDSLCCYGHTKEAIRLCWLFAEKKLPMDKMTWWTIFAAAKADYNVENVIQGFEMAKTMSVPAIDLYGNALHACFYFADAESRRNEPAPPWAAPMFRPMLRMYAKKFKLESLQWWLPDSLPSVLGRLGECAAVDEKFRDRRQRDWDFLHTIMPVVDKVFSEPGETQLKTNTTSDETKLEESTTPDETKLEANITIIAVMLRAYIRSLQYPQDILSFYNYFKSLIVEGHLNSRLLMRDQGALIHDSFILAMCEHPELWREALHIFGDMVKDSLQDKMTAKMTVETDDLVMDASLVNAGSPDMADDKAAVGGVPGRRYSHPRPTVFTFTILIRSLLWNREIALANQVLQAMPEFEVEANLVTWNTLIRHHAFTQNVHMMVNLMRELESAGLKPDDYTFRAFGYLRNQKEAFRMMQSIIDENRNAIIAQERQNN